jgi:Amt family ammonium transporter
VQIIAALATAGFAFLMTAVLARILNRTVGLSVTSTEEQIGLDIAEHGERAYA